MYTLVFGLNTRARAKHAKAASAILQEPVRGYGIGVAHFRMTTAAWAIVWGFVTVFAIALAYGVILVPGFLVGIVLLQLVRPRRGVAVTNKELVVLSTSALGGRPTGLLCREPFDLTFSRRGTKHVATLGDDRITLSEKELNQIALCVPLDARAQI